jgi:hypothetical protein
LAELPAAPVLTSPLLTTAKQPAAAKVAAGPSDGIATALDVLRNAGFTVDIKATKNPAYLNAYVFHAAGLRGSLLFKA